MSANRPPAQTPGSFAGRIREFIERERLFAGINRLLVGFSGGADSTALVMVLAELDLIPFQAIHLHHGLRGAAADADAEWCARFCASRGIPFAMQTLLVPAQRRAGENLEAAARRCRLDYWQRHCVAGEGVALGHHADDCLEEVFLRLARGANTSGLAGLRPLRDVRGVRLVRPLLACRRVEIEEYLRSRGVDQWREDHTNRDARLRRNAIRHHWLPMVRATLGSDTGLIRSLEAIRDDADFLEAAAAKQVNAAFGRESFSALHPALQPRVLRLAAYERLGIDLVVSRETLARVRKAAARHSAEVRRVPLGGGVLLLLVGQEMRFCPASGTVEEAASVWNWRVQPVFRLAGTGWELRAELVGCRGQEMRQADKLTEYFSEAALPAGLQVRTRRAGDCMIPFGRRRAKKVKDLMIDAGVAPEERDRLPVILAGEQIIWLPGVRRAEFGRLDDGAAATAVRLTAVRHS